MPVIEQTISLFKGLRRKPLPALLPMVVLLALSGCATRPSLVFLPSRSKVGTAISSAWLAHVFPVINCAAGAKPGMKS
jgi:hypothetical protein